MAKKDVSIKPVPAPIPTIKDPSKEMLAEGKIKQTVSQKVKVQKAVRK